MLSVNGVFSKLKNTLGSKSGAKKTGAKGKKRYRLSYLRVALGLLLLGGLWVIVATVGASDPAKAQVEKKKKNINIDVRVNGGQGDLTNVIGRNNLKTTGKESSLVARTASNQLAMIKDGIGQLKTKSPDADVKLSDMTGAVETVSSMNALTGAAQGRTGESIVRGFISSNKNLYGLTEKELDSLHFIGESISPESGLRMVRVEQQVDGHPVFQSESRFVLDRDGRLFRSTGLFVPGATDIALPLDNLISPQEALKATMAPLGVDLDVAQMSEAEATSDSNQLTEITVNDERIHGNVTSKIVYFPAAPGVLVPAFSQIIFGEKEDWYALVDARNGTLLWRKNIRDSVSTQDARFRVYVQTDGKTPADSPAPLSPTTATPGSGFQAPAIAPTIVSMMAAQNIIASPNGWIDDCPGGVCTAAQTQTIGNNVHAYLDRQAGANNNLPDTNAANVIDGNGKPTGNPDANSRNRDFLGTAPRDFQTGFLPPPQGGNPEAGQTAGTTAVAFNGNNGTTTIDSYRRGVITQLFYTSNWYHDQLYALGFDEAAGNFQQTNFTGMGTGNDRVLAEAQDNGDVNNANFSTPPDGSSGRMQMYVFTGPTIDRDGSLDAEIVMHELTHGVSNRLIGNGAGLNWDIGGGMGEGWSDFYALSLLNNTNADDPNGKYASGAYATYKLAGLPYTDNYTYGIRRFPYSTDNTVNPLTWADTDDVTNDLSGGIAPSPVNFNGNGAAEVHNIGEIWALTLWEVRSRIIAANANDVPTGNQKTLRIVTDALKMTPINPSFTDARDAIIAADCATNACANEDSIWGGFADRGLGYRAYAPVTRIFNANTGGAGHASLKESFVSPNLDAVSYTIDDSLGNNNGFVDPGEQIKLTVTLKNPWRQTTKGVSSATATLTTSTAGVTIPDGSSAYGPIAANTSAAPTAGDTFIFTAPLAAACGQSLKFTVTANSTLGTFATDITLRVGQPSGTGAPITYTSDPNPDIAIPDNSPRGVKNTLTITDDFQISDLNFRIDSITHTWDSDLTALLKGPNGYGTDLLANLGLFVGTGNADNITNMVIDDTAAAPNDQLTAAPAQAPFTDDYLPIYNSPTWALTFLGAGDPVGDLSRFNGISTQGDWTILVSDEVGGDTGTLNKWSMIITPTSFVCAPVTADLAVTKLDSPDPVIPGNNIAYTINVTNNGPNGSLPPTLTDNIPANTTFQSITAPAGWTCTTPAVGATGAVSCTATLSLASGATAGFTLVVNVNNGVANGTTITNTATVTSATTDPTPANNTAVATTTVNEFTSPGPTGLPTKALLVKPAAGNTTAGGGVSDSSCVAPTGVTVAGVFANINQSLGAAAVGDTIYVCPKYTGNNVVPYVEHVSLGFTNLSVVGISDAKGSRAVIAANPSTATSPTTQVGTNYIVQIVATGVNFGNFVVDGAPGGTNFAGTGIFNGIAVRRSGAFVFNNTVQNIRTGDLTANADGQGIAVFGAGTAGTPIEAGTAANPVNILNNVVQTYRTNGVSVTAGSSSAYAFVRGNYIIGNGSAAGTANQTGVQFQAGANGDIFNNRITRILDNVGGCSAAAFNNCSAGIRLNTTASSSASNLRVRFNLISNTQTGIFAQNVQFVSMTSNTISHSVIDGINLRGSALNLGSNFNTINQNTIFSARRSGVFIGLVGGDASLGNNLTQNTIEDTFTGVANNPPAGNNTIPTTGATANTFISVNNFVGSATSGVNDVQNTNPLP